MQKFLCLLFLFSILSPFAAFSQEPKRKSEITAGGFFALGIMADSVYANVYKLPLLGGLELGYIHRGAKTWQSLNLRAGLGGLHSAYLPVEENFPPLSDSTFEFRLQYAWAFILVQKPRFLFLMGPGAHFSGGAWLPDSPQADLLRYTWFFHTGGGLRLHFSWDVSPQNTLSLGLYTPLLSVGWRPPYSGYTLKEETLLESRGFVAAAFSQAHFLFWHNFFSVDARFAFHHQISPLLGFALEYNFFLEYLRIPRPRLELQNYVLLGLTFRF